MNFKKTAARPNKCQQKRIGYNKEMQSGGAVSEKGKPQNKSYCYVWRKKTDRLHEKYSKETYQSIKSLKNKNKKAKGGAR